MSEKRLVKWPIPLGKWMMPLRANVIVECGLMTARVRLGSRLGGFAFEKPDQDHECDDE